MISKALVNLEVIVFKRISEKELKICPEAIILPLTSKLVIGLFVPIPTLPKL